MKTIAAGLTSSTSDLVHRLRNGPVADYSDVETAIALAQLLREWVHYLRDER